VNENQIVCDLRVKQNVVKYIELSMQSDSSFNLSPLVHSREAIIIWGAGSYAQRLLKESLLGKCNIVAFIDRDSKKWGTKLHGAYVVAPDNLKDLQGTIIVCAALYSDDIVNDIHAMGFRNNIIVLK
jgi:FlaA1/EpsC-like NDP-sugar epimerase